MLILEVLVDSPGRIEQHIIDILTAQHRQDPLVHIHDGQVPTPVPIHELITMNTNNHIVPQCSRGLYASAQSQQQNPLQQLQSHIHSQSHSTITCIHSIITITITIICNHHIHDCTHCQPQTFTHEDENHHSYSLLFPH